MKENQVIIAIFLFSILGLNVALLNPHLPFTVGKATEVLNDLQVSSPQELVTLMNENPVEVVFVVSPYVSQEELDAIVKLSDLSGIPYVSDDEVIQKTSVIIVGENNKKIRELKAENLGDFYYFQGNLFIVGDKITNKKNLDQLTLAYIHGEELLLAQGPSEKVLLKEEEENNPIQVPKTNEQVNLPSVQTNVVPEKIKTTQSSEKKYPFSPKDSWMISVLIIIVVIIILYLMEHTRHHHDYRTINALSNFIKEERKRRVPDDFIREILLKRGWKNKAIDQAFGLLWEAP